MQIEETRRGAILVLTPVGRIDNETGPAFQTRLLAEMSGGGATILLDLSKVQYISSAGLHVLIAATKQSKALNGRLAVAALQPIVKEIFTISRLSHVVSIFDDVTAAVAAWS